MNGKAERHALSQHSLRAQRPACLFILCTDRQKPSNGFALKSALQKIILLGLRQRVPRLSDKSCQHQGTLNSDPRSRTVPAPCQAKGINNGCKLCWAGTRRKPCVHPTGSTDVVRFFSSSSSLSVRSNSNNTRVVEACSLQNHRRLLHELSAWSRLMLLQRREAWQLSHAPILPSRPHLCGLPPDQLSFSSHFIPRSQSLFLLHRAPAAMAFGIEAWLWPC